MELRFLDERWWVMRGMQVKTDEAEQTGGLSLQKFSGPKTRVKSQVPQRQGPNITEAAGGFVAFKFRGQDRPISQIWGKSDKETKNVGKKRGEFGCDILSCTLHGIIALTTSTLSLLVPTRKQSRALIQT